ncbi:MAG: DUF2384 domain-containing protein [Mycobacterium sp.]|nr:MAG: DUF2384 domain-containing protein [Mycobacterium sp.]
MMAVPTQEKVAALIRDFGSAHLAELLGVGPAHVERWQRDEAIDAISAERIDLLEVVMAHLLRLYSIEAAQRWLVGLNPHLGDRRPIDLILRRQIHGVLAAIANERAGSSA